MNRRSGLKVSVCVVLVAAYLAASGTTASQAVSTDDTGDKPDPLAVLSKDQRERFLAENADGPMVINWTETPYEKALAQTLAELQPDVISELPDPLSFPNVANDGLKPPDLSTIAPSRTRQRC